MTTCPTYREWALFPGFLVVRLADFRFPPSWPVYTPALKLADWLESYANSLELNVWTSATVTSIRREVGNGGKRWSVLVEREGGQKRTFKVDHVVLALGIGGGIPRIPDIPGQVSLERVHGEPPFRQPGQDEFKGQILHSCEHKCATDHLGKKVVVIGACTSGTTDYLFSSPAELTMASSRCLCRLCGAWRR